MPQYSLFTALVSVVTPGHVLTSEILERGTPDGREHATFLIHIFFFLNPYTSTGHLEETSKFGPDRWKSPQTVSVSCNRGSCLTRGRKRPVLRIKTVTGPAHTLFLLFASIIYSSEGVRNNSGNENVQKFAFWVSLEAREWGREKGSTLGMSSEDVKVDVN